MKKSILSLALIAAMLFCTANDAIASTINEENPTADSVEYLFDPGSGQYLPVRNIEDEIAAITKASERNYEFEQARLKRPQRFQGALTEISGSVHPAPIPWQSGTSPMKLCPCGER